MTKKPSISNPNDAVLWCKEAVSYLERNDLASALYCYRESVKINPHVPDVWYNILCLAEKNGDKALAFSAACTGEKMFTSDFRFPAEKARLLAEDKKFTEAIEASKQALAINPASPILLSNTSGYLLMTGKNEDALKIAEQALEIDPLYKSAILHKAHALVNLKKLSEAAEILDNKHIIDDIRAIKMQINICVRLQNFVKAIELIEKAIEIAPEDDEIWCLCGIAHACQNETDLAVKAFNKAIQLNPHEKSYHTNLRILKKR